MQHKLDLLEATPGTARRASSELYQKALRYPGLPGHMREMATARLAEAAALPARSPACRSETDQKPDASQASPTCTSRRGRTPCRFPW